VVTIVSRYLRDDYVQVYLSDGKVTREHRCLMEEYLGRKLNENEVIHHIDGNGHNNLLSNLELLTKEEHPSHHKTGVTFITILCPNCKKKFSREKRETYGSERNFCSKSCSTSFYKGGKRKSTKHGEYGKYRKGCRCDLCKQANSERMRKYNKKRLTAV